MNQHTFCEAPQLDGFEWKIICGVPKTLETGPVEIVEFPQKKQHGDFA